MRNRRRRDRRVEGGGGGALTYDREAHLRVLFERVSRADSADAWPIVLECLDEAVREPERVVPVPGVLRVILHLVADGDREHAGALYTRLKEWAAAANTRLLAEDPRWKTVRELMETAPPAEVEVAAAALEDPQRAERILHPPEPPRRPYVPPAQPQSNLGCIAPILASLFAFVLILRMGLGNRSSSPPYNIPPFRIYWDAGVMPPLAVYDPVQHSAERVRAAAGANREVVESADLVEMGARRGDCDDVKRGLERMPRADAGAELARAQDMLDDFARARCP